MASGPFVGLAAPIAAFVAITRRRAERTRTRSESGGQQRSGGWQGRGYFGSRCKGALAPAENSRDLAIAGPGRLPFDRPLEGQGATLSDNGDVALTGDHDMRFKSPAMIPQRRHLAEGSGRRPLAEQGADRPGRLLVDHRGGDRRRARENTPRRICNIR